MSDAKSNYQTRSKNAKRKTRDQQHNHTVEKRKNTAKPKKRKITNKKAQGEIIDAVDEIICYKCGYGHDEENLLLCDNCPRGFHMECLDPPLLSTPSSAWWCPICTSIIPVYDDDETKFDLNDVVPGYTDRNFPLEAWKKIVLYLKKEEQLSLRLVNRFFDNLVSNTIFYRLTSKIPFDNLLKFRHPWAVKEFLIYYDEKTGTSMKKLGEILQRFSNIELLDIHGENFTSQALEIVGKYLLNIKALHFNFSNRISSLPINVKFGLQFGNLECVELDYHTIPNRPYLYDLTLVKKFLTELVNLKHIQFQLIETKSSKSLWSCIAQCVTLESLGIQFRGDWDFINLTSIKHIKHLNIEALHTEVEQDFTIKGLDNLQSVILRLGDKMKNFEISNCKNLSKIDISSRGTKIAASIKHCPKLKELYLYGINEISLDPQSSNFENLTIGDINDYTNSQPYIDLKSESLVELNLLNVYSHLIFRTPNLKYLSIDYDDPINLEYYTNIPKIEFQVKLSKLIRLQLINIGYKEILDEQINQIQSIATIQDKIEKQLNGEANNTINLESEPVIWVGYKFFEQLYANFPLLETLKVIFYGDDQFNFNRRVFIQHPCLRTVILKNIDLGGEATRLPRLTSLKMTSNLAASSLLNNIDHIAPNIQFMHLDLTLLPKTKIKSKSLTHLDIISSPLDSSFSLDCPNLTYLKVESNLLETDITKLISDKRTPQLEELSITSTSDRLTPIKGTPPPKIKHSELKTLYIGSVIREQGIEIVCPSLRDLKIILEEDSDKFKFSSIKVPKLAWAVCYPQRIALDLKKHSLNEGCKLTIPKKK